MNGLTPYQMYFLATHPSYEYDPETQKVSYKTSSGASAWYKSPLRGFRYSDTRIPAGNVVTGGLVSKEDKLRACQPEFVAFLEANGFTIEDHYAS